MSLSLQLKILTLFLFTVGGLSDSQLLNCEIRTKYSLLTLTPSPVFFRVEVNSTQALLQLSLCGKPSLMCNQNFPTQKYTKAYFLLYINNHCIPLTAEVPINTSDFVLNTPLKDRYQQTYYRAEFSNPDNSSTTLDLFCDKDHQFQAPMVYSEGSTYYIRLSGRKYCPEIIQPLIYQLINQQSSISGLIGLIVSAYFLFFSFKNLSMTIFLLSACFFTFIGFVSATEFESATYNLNYTLMICIIVAFAISILVSRIKVFKWIILGVYFGCSFHLFCYLSLGIYKIVTPNPEYVLIIPLISFTVLTTVFAIHYFRKEEIDCLIERAFFIAMSITFFSSMLFLRSFLLLAGSDAYPSEVYIAMKKTIYPWIEETYILPTVVLIIFNIFLGMVNFRSALHLLLKTERWSHHYVRLPA